jgi:hypothetical protein
VRLSCVRREVLRSGQIVPVGRQRPYPALKTLSEQHRVHGVDQRPQPSHSKRWDEPTFQPVVQIGRM